MHISTMDVEDVVLKIYRDLCVPANGRLSHATLLKEWARTPLRADDLSNGIRRLERLRHVQCVQSPEGMCVVLTATGHERASEQRTRLHQTWRLGLTLRLRRLMHARRVAESAPPPVLARRRLSDRIVPQL